MGEYVARVLCWVVWFYVWVVCGEVLCDRGMWYFL